MSELSAYQVMEAFYDLAEGRCSIKLKNGQGMEGHFLELHPNHILWGEGGPLAPDVDQLIPLENIRLDQLSYYCNRLKTYVDFDPNF